MRIKSLELKNFKRFTDLTISDIPETAKLVLLIGSNGSGKSSVFDAFAATNSLLNRTLVGQPLPPNKFIVVQTVLINGVEVSFFQTDYYRKIKSEAINVKIEFNNDREVKIEGDLFIGENINKTSNLFYGRSSYRQVPKLTRTKSGLGSTSDFETDGDRPKSMIDRDERFENDIEIVSVQIFREIFREPKSASDIIDKYIKPLNKAFESIFGSSSETSLKIIEIIQPLNNQIAQITFKKGDFEFHYNFLSAGEKEIFNIVFNLLVRKNQYQDTIYFIDEMDVHLNTQLQYNLIKEITENWIPENSQLWTASHSLGFIEYANESENAVIFDFDDLNFDVKQELKPIDKNNYQVFEIAVSKEFVEKAFNGRDIFFAEQTDAPIYNDLSIENTFFFDGKDKLGAFQKAKNLKLKAIIDRDYLSDVDVEMIKESYPFIFVLPYYSIENLFYHPDNLAEYFSKKGKTFDKKKYLDKITKEKNDHRDTIVFGISKARDSYPFFKENDNAEKLKIFKESGKLIIELLRSDNLESFYKVFPAKDYGTTIPERQNLIKKELAKTKWFKNEILKVLKEPQKRKK